MVWLRAQPSLFNPQISENHLEKRHIWSIARFIEPSLKENISTRVIQCTYMGSHIFTAAIHTDVMCHIKRLQKD